MASRPATPKRILLSNADGAGINDGATMLARLVAQVIAPVRWDLCMRTIADLGVTGIIELPPAGTLAGLAKRELKGIEIVTLNTPDDLKAAKDLISRHGMAPSHEPTMAFVLAVATVGGTFEPTPRHHRGRTHQGRPGPRPHRHPTRSSRGNRARLGPADRMAGLRQ